MPTSCMRGVGCLVFAAMLAVGGARGAAEEELDPAIALRDSLLNSRVAFEQGPTGHVAFLGGSITEMNGYRPLVAAWLEEKFRDTKFTFTNAGIASTCSTTGAFRLERDVLSAGPVDLLLVEFAVNDDQDAAHAAREALRGMEGVIRRLKTANPKADVVMIHFTNPEMLAAAQEGKTPVSVAAHEQVAEHYNIPSVNIPEALAARIAAKTLTWERYGGTHPGREGNRFAADLVDELLAAAWKAPLPEQLPVPAALPAPLDTHSYDRGWLAEPDAAQFGDDWNSGVTDWKNLAGSLRERFAGKKLLTAAAPGAELTFSFTGRGVGAYVLAGPDAGGLEASIDGGPFHRVELYHRFSRGLHYPRTVMFAADLPAAEHTLTLRISRENHAESSGVAARILAFAVNE